MAFTMISWGWNRTQYWRYGRKRPSNQNKISSKYLWNSHLVSVNINSKFHGRKNWWAGITKTLFNQFLWTLGTYKKKQKKRQNETYTQTKQSIRNKINRKNKQNKEKDTNRQRHRTEKRSTHKTDKQTNSKTTKKENKRTNKQQMTEHTNK